MTFLIGKIKCNSLHTADIKTKINVSIKKYFSTIKNKYFSFKLLPLSILEIKRSVMQHGDGYD